MKQLSTECFIKQLPGYIFWVDNDNRIQYSSAKQTQIFGDNGSHPLLSDYLDEKQVDALDILHNASTQTKEALTFKLLDVTYQAKALLDEQAQKVGLLFTCIESDEQYQRALENAASKTEQTLESISSLFPCHVFWLDMDCRLIGCNKAMSDALNISDEEIIGLTVEECLPKEEADLIAKTNQYILNTGSYYLAEEEGTYADGKKRMFLSQKAPLRDKNGEITGLIGVSIDITARKTAEQELETAKEKAELANLAKTEFIANISHDLRTPLNAIIGMADMLSIKKHLPEQADFIKGISQAARAILNLIQDILSYSKMESNKYEPNYELFNLKEAIHEIVSTVEHQAKKEGVNLIFNYCDGLPHQLIGDPHATRRILSNLIGNAMKFTKSGYILVSIEIIDEQDDDIQLQLSVEDSGIGMTSDEIKRIFDRFYRAEPSYKGRYAGTGLGLAITKQFVEDLGGSINVHSTKGAGSTFWVSLPFKRDKQTAPHVDSWEENYANIPVLVVDDHIVRGKNLLRHIHSNSIQLTSSGQAIKTLQEAVKNEKPYKVVIVDDEIKSLSPDKLAHMIKHKIKPSTLLILHSRQKSIPELESAKNSGYFRIIKKPMQTNELIQALISTWKNWQNCAEQTPQPLKKLRVLLVDDNFLGQKISKALLEELNCIVDVASSGEECIKKAKKAFDLIFLDIGLPDLSGLEVAKILKKDSANKDTPIIALTAHTGEEDKRVCLESGMIDFLGKPASFDDFKRVLMHASIPSVARISND